MIYLYGDTHGDMEINKIAPIEQYTSEDIIIILGDFGFPFYPKEYAIKLNYTKSYDYWCKWLSTFPCDILFVDGNHDNHDFGQSSQQKKDMVVLFKRIQILLIVIIL